MEGPVYPGSISVHVQEGTESLPVKVEASDPEEDDDPLVTYAEQQMQVRPDQNKKLLYVPYLLLFWQIEIYIFFEIHPDQPMLNISAW